MAEPRISGFHAAAADRAEGRVDLLARFVPHPDATFLVRCDSGVLASRLDPGHGGVVIATAGDDVLVRILDRTPAGHPRTADPPHAPVLLGWSAGAAGSSISGGG